MDVGVMKIGVIGLGAVGKQIFRIASETCEAVLGYDQRLSAHNSEPMWEAIIGCEVVFVCVAAKTNPSTWTQDLTDLCDVLNRLFLWEFKGVVCLKTTLLPCTTRVLADKYPLRFVHSPEFSRNESMEDDFGKTGSFLISGDEDDTLPVARAYRLMRPKTPSICTSRWEETELAKHMHNAFLAVKVSFCNEFEELCRAIKVDYSFVRGIACNQGAIGHGHTQVPGPDGQKGYGGRWLSQDVCALLYWSETSPRVQMHTVGAAIMTNRYRRPNLYSKKFDESIKAKKAAKSGTLIEREAPAVSHLPVRPTDVPDGS